MNAKIANRIPLTDILTKIGFEPIKVRRGGDDLWYHSPLHAEKQASFHVCVSRNIWKDFGGNGNGGKVIDFLIEYLNTDVKGSLYWLKKNYNSLQLPLIDEQYLQKVKTLSVTYDIEFLEAKNIQHPALFQYLCSRNIPKHIGELYLKEIHFLNTRLNRKFFGLGLKNIKGGYELRNGAGKEGFKGQVGEKNISFISGENETGKLHILEGTYDFLSLVSWRWPEQSKPSNDCLILNSTSFLRLEPTIELIKNGNYNEIFSWTDNNETGKKATEFLKDTFGNVHDMKKYFEPHSDLNEWWVSKL